VSKKLLKILSEVDELRAMFTSFEQTEQQKIGNKVVFSNRQELLDTLLQINADKIIQCIQSDIQRVKSQLKSYSDEKDKQIQNLIAHIY
jgi:hypothetical protein